MSTRTHPFILAVAAIAGALALPTGARAQLTDTATVTIRASVEAIDRTNRIVALQGPEGNIAEFQVSEDVERFDELAVGDTITATYTEAIAVTLRKPGEPEPLADQTSVDGGQAMARRTVSVTVEEVDASVPSLTVRNPDDEVLSFRVPDDVSLEEVEVGDNIDVTYTIALVVDVN